MPEPPSCPHCRRETHPRSEALPEYGNFTCAWCQLSAPREVLEALAARMAPAGVLEAAERLLRAARVSEAQFTWTTVLLARDADAYEPTLAEAYDKLTKGERDG